MNLPVELNKHKVPHFKDSRVIHVHKRSSITPTNPIIMNLTAWSTRSSFTHLPKIVLHTKWKHSFRWKAKICNYEVSKQFSSAFIVYCDQLFQQKLHVVTSPELEILNGALRCLHIGIYQFIFSAARRMLVE